MNIYLKYVISLSSLFSIISTNSYVPIIAIVSLPEPTNQIVIEKTQVMAHYVKWIEIAGGKTIAIHPWMNDDELKIIFGKVNGFLWQGGGKELDLNDQYEIFTKKILVKIIELKFVHNISIPLWTTCLGFELLSMFYANTHDVLSSFNSYNLQSPLIFNETIIENSRMFSYFSKEDLNNLKNRNTTAHFHHKGVNVENFEKYPFLNQTFKITSYGVGLDKNNTSIESFEAYDYPLYGVQFHPEKIASDYIASHEIPQSPEAIRTSNNLAIFFVNEAKKNNNIFKEEDKKTFDFIDMYNTKFENKSGNMVVYYNKNSTNTSNNFVRLNHNHNIKFLE